MAGTITGHKHLLSPLSVCYNHRALLCSCMQVNSFIGYSQTDLEVQKDCCLCDSEAACFFLTLRPNCSFHWLEKTVPVLVLSVTPSHVCTCSHHFHFCVYGLVEEAHRLDIFHPMALDAIFVASLPCCICRTEGNEGWSLIWQPPSTPHPTPPLSFLPHSCSSTPRKMQLVCELIPAPAKCK